MSCSKLPHVPSYPALPNKYGCRADRCLEIAQESPVSSSTLIATTLSATPTAFALPPKKLQAGYFWWCTTQFTLPEQSDWCDNVPIRPSLTLGCSPPPRPIEQTLNSCSDFGRSTIFERNSLLSVMAYSKHWKVIPQFVPLNDLHENICSLWVGAVQTERLRIFVQLKFVWGGKKWKLA